MTNSDYFPIQLSLTGFMIQTNTVHCAVRTEYLRNIAINLSNLKFNIDISKHFLAHYIFKQYSVTCNLFMSDSKPWRQDIFMFRPLEINGLKPLCAMSSQIQLCIFITKTI